MQNPQSIQLHGQLTSADMRQTRPIPVQMPEGVTQVHFRFRYSPKFAPNQRLAHQISLMIFDTEGPRFEISRPDDQGVWIHEAEASPGGMAGPIQPGTWQLFILVHRLLSDEPVRYELDITLSFDPIERQPRSWQPGLVASRGPGWYRGDLHAHSIHSDGSLDVPELVNFWREQGVDFMTLSDHNTLSGLAQVRSLSDDDLLTLGGIELSTYWGHAVAVGVRRWFDWRKLDGSQLTMPELAQQVIDAGCLFTIAHPMDPGDPMCCGCRWEYDDMMPGNALAVEVWNGLWSARNQEALSWFYRWLNQGYRLTAVSGTDLHTLPRSIRRTAVNVVYAQELSEPAIVDALKAGHSYISSGPELLLTAHTSAGEVAMIGDTLPPGEITLRATWRDGDDGDSLRLVLDGKVYREHFVAGSGEMCWTLAPGRARWFVVELRNPSNDLLAVTNPIFVATAGSH